jgi:hypothetical protein
MHRNLTDHLVAGSATDKLLAIVAIDAPGAGGASHHYEMRLNHPQRGIQLQRIDFQEGPIANPADVNGVTNEALLAILIDRLRGFQGLLATATGAAGFPSRENAIALTHLEEGLLWLQKRTRDRMARGVEGQNKA